MFFPDLTKNRYNFDSFTPDSYCWVAFFLQSKGKEVSAFFLNSQVSHVLNILTAHQCASHWLKISGLKDAIPRFHKITLCFWCGWVGEGCVQAS